MQLCRSREFLSNPASLISFAALIAFAALLPATATAHAATRTFTLTAEDRRIDIGSDLTYDAWTFNGTVPGPVLRVRQGDLVTIHLLNRTTMAHGIDIQAAQVAPNKHFASKSPHEELTYTFRAEVPGAFLYHCSAIPMLVHIANGMYGMMIVEPKSGWPKAQEVTIVQGEFYGSPDKHGFIAGDSKKMMAEHPDFIVFNGAINKYVDHPITIKVGQPVRVFFVNAGPNLMSTFHVIGAIFTAVYRNGNPENAMHWLQSFEVGPGDGAVIEFTVHEAGDYKFVDHAMARPLKGAQGIFHAVP
ncbi:MAG: multicopper oxidase domain-containing protein [Candidatus Binataceae bacterium]